MPFIHSITICRYIIIVFTLMPFLCIFVKGIFLTNKKGWYWWLLITSFDGPTTEWFRVLFLMGSTTITFQDSFHRDQALLTLSGCALLVGHPRKEKNVSCIDTHKENYFEFNFKMHDLNSFKYKKSRVTWVMWQTEFRQFIVNSETFFGSKFRTVTFFFLSFFSR